MNNPIIPFYKQMDKYIVKAKDCYMFDSYNKRYIDFESGDWAANLGHSNETITRVLKRQSELLVHDGLRFRNKESEALSLKLLEVLGLINGKSAFVNSGSEAVNLAITLAKSLTGRNRILKMDCSYLAAYGHGQISSGNTDLINVPLDDMDSISTIDFKSIAAFAFEPGNSSSQIRYPQELFIKTIADKVTQNGGLLIANEVTTGFGRTGKWFGFQHYDYQPDIVSVGKALGNGYPISGVCVSAEVSAMFDQSSFRYAQSHQNDPLGCAVGLEVIKYIESNDLINQAYEKGRYFKDLLIELQGKQPERIMEIRARGLMIGMEMDSVENADLIYNQLIQHGYLVGLREKVIRFMPPLIINKTDMDELVKTMDKIL
ncbi:MAG TPA: aspartate aminotransferase family protein [Prolixibacteraceae bacterium]|nr:aspartate aminotransferase family protein [Prolixibacteraceae bacterium]